MNGRQAVARLEAFRAGRPLPSGETLHFPIADDRDLLTIAFLRMGGESSPWAIGYGHPGMRPAVLSVPEPRNRGLVAAMVAEFASVLLDNLGHPDYAFEPMDKPQPGQRHRQVWIPNRAHLEMLHELAYAYTFTRWGEASRAKLLNTLGRATGWLFNEGNRPGQVTILAANDALAESFTFPCETVRQGHLGFLMSWLETEGDYGTRQRAATEAERTPVSTNLDPVFERDVLAPLVEAWNEAERSGDQKRTQSIAGRVHDALEPEVLRRLALVERAIGLLRNEQRPRNFGVDQLRDASASEHWYQYLRLEQKLNDDEDGPAFTPSPETDRYPAAAASRFFVNEDSEELRVGALIHYDRQLRDQAIAEGDGIAGMIETVHDEGNGRRATPVWTVVADGRRSLRLREGSRVCVADIPKRVGMIRRIDPLPDGRRRFEVEITEWKTENRLPGRHVVPHAASPTLRDTHVILLQHVNSGLSRLKSKRVWDRNGPGAWLTHQVPRGRAADLPPDVGEDLAAIDRALEDPS